MVSRTRSVGATLSWGGFFLRLIIALCVVFATYNPEGYSYYHWIKQELPNVNALLVLAGVILLIAWAIFIRATFRSLGPIGVTLAVAFFGSIVWLMVEKEIISPDNIRVFSYIVLAMVAAVLGVGLSWSFIRRRMTGQFDVDDVD